MKTTLHSSPARTAVLLAALAAQAATPAGADKVEVPMSAYQPLAFLVGHCWRGTFPDGRATDEHCFSWIYGGRFVRAAVPLHRECRRVQPRYRVRWPGGTRVPTHDLLRARSEPDLSQSLGA